MKEGKFYRKSKMALIRNNAKKMIVRNKKDFKVLFDSNEIEDMKLLTHAVIFALEHDIRSKETIIQLIAGYRHILLNKEGGWDNFMAERWLSNEIQTYGIEACLKSIEEV